MVPEFLIPKSSQEGSILGYCTAKRQRGKDFQLLGTITHWVNHLHLSFPHPLSVTRVFASWRPGVNSPLQAHARGQNRLVVVKPEF
jgi:hypothetical protein